MTYINEHTLIGQAGHLLIIIAFVASLTSLYSYIIASRNHGLISGTWNTFSRAAFLIHSLSVAAVVGLLFFMISQHYFEYHYVWKYSNLAMEAKYIFSCFWSGQEGSLLLWSFWIVVLSWVLILNSKEWEKHVMPFIIVIQAFIFSMLLGVYIGDVKIGNSPFILIRELPENAGLPWSKMSDYLVQITAFQDGVGLNPLLQNYWMTIHPPVLFLGFAATLFPFAFALAGMTRRLYNGWVKPAFPWGLFAMLSLGAGILLGGAWAYESLSFGGFWAWDPVENASLVPWLLMVAGVHCMQVTAKRDRGSFVSALFTTSPFLLVVYSTFLTRSGILGESSVHSFTENGLFVHLLSFLLFIIAGTVFLLLTNKKLKIGFSFLSIILLGVYLVSGSIQYTLPVWILGIGVFLLVNYERYYPKEEGEINKTSREFWMFAGALFILVSSIQITLSTSIPVINRIFNLKLDAFTDLSTRNDFYHTWQIPIAAIISILIGVTHFMQYRKTESSAFYKKTGITFLISVVLTGILIVVFSYNPIREWHYTLLLFSVIIAIVFNADFARRTWVNRQSSTGSSLAHIGFVVLLLGALISGSRRTVISENKASFSLQELNKDFKNDENILLKQGDTVLMDQFFVTYRGRHKKGVNLNYEISYFKPEWDSKSNRLTPGDSMFTLYPIVQMNEQFGNVAEPGTQHFLAYDIFTHIKYADMEADAQQGYTSDGFMGETQFKLGLGSHFELENYQFHFRDIYLIEDTSEKEKLGFHDHDVIVQANLEVTNTDLKENSTFTIEPLFVVRDSSHVLLHETFSKELDAKIRIAELPQEDNTIVLGIRQREFVVMQAFVFPGMNILWTGCLLMIVGCAISLRKYVVRSKKPVPGDVTLSTEPVTWKS